MFARISYTTTKHVNSRLWNPGYSLNKVFDESVVPLEDIVLSSENIVCTESNEHAPQDENRKSNIFDKNETHEDSGISDVSSTSGESESTQTESTELYFEELLTEVRSSKSERFDFPLNSTWKLYSTKPEAKNWDEKLVLIGEIATVEEFWAFYQHTKLPSHLRQNSDYFFFRSDIEPCWESADNIDGGRWIIEIEKTDRNAHLNNLWLETLLALIGEQLGDSELINGAVVQSRRGKDKVSIWVREGEDEAEIRALGNRYKNVTGGQFRLRFQKHQSSIKNNSSSRKPFIMI